GTTVTTQFVPDTTVPPFDLNGPSLRPIECTEVRSWCQDFQNDINQLLIKRKRVETRTTFRTWVDHGTPPGTFVDSEPSVAVTFRSGRPGRVIFLKGLDGHLWELRQTARSGLN